MKISDQYTTSMVGAAHLKEKEKKAGKAKAGETPRPSDGVRISGKSQEIAHARALALAAPEVRQELVDEIVGLLTSGKYTITGEDVAPKLIQDHLSLWT